MDAKNRRGRIRNLLLFPGWEWKVINLEKRTLKETFISYALPLILIGALSKFAGSFLYVRNELDIDAYRFSFPLICTGLFIFSQVLTIMLTTVFVYGLAGSFQSVKDYSKSGKIVIYAYTPVYLLFIVANLHASLSFLMIPGFYAIVLLWTGLPVLLQTPSGKLPAYVILIVISVFGIQYIAELLLSFLTTLIFPGVS